MDRSMTFDFDIPPEPGRVKSSADYRSGHLSGSKGATFEPEQLRNNWFTVNFISDFTAISLEKVKPMATPNDKVLTRAKDSVVKEKTRMRSNANQADKAQMCIGKQIEAQLSRKRKRQTNVVRTRI